MGLFDGVKRAIGAQKPTITRIQQLSALPIRNPVVVWEKGEDKNAGLALLRIPRKPGKFADWTAKMMRLPEYRKLELDEIGTDVWELCDGQHSIEQVTIAIVTKYKLNRRQSEASVLAFLKMMAERKLVAVLPGNTKSGEAKTKQRPLGKRKRA